MKKAPRFPSRWAGPWRTLGIAVVLSAALGACSSVENVMYGAREGTIEYPGSAAGTNAVPSYVVKNKDTVDGVAQRFGVSPQTIIDRNNLKPPYALKAGQTIAIPGARVIEPSSGASSSTATAAAAPNPPAAVKRETLAPPGQGEAPHSASPAAATPAPATPPPGQPTPLSPAASHAAAAGPAPRFEWPVRGKVVSSYGSHDGQRNDGIDIEAPKDTVVHAADSGTVVYAGNEVRGMGNLLLVSHSGGYITAYGYNDSLLVKKGDTIKKGQAIAKVGTTGSASDPRLHFEVRRGNKTLDPATVLPGQ
ncbi:MAG: M23 family metallopeptidase [Alphaproteobacteria bacterium]|nr:M23 family metallopeptidase [Alphaproteobacteria bacterium]